jgi:peptide/nickel transport system ATP-binding protein
MTTAANPHDGGTAAAAPLLDVVDLTVGYVTDDGVRIELVRDVSLQIAEGEVVSIVGESGSG